MKFSELLKASKGLPVDDSIAALWGKKIYDANQWKITTLTGPLPLSFLSKGDALKNYRIHGTSEGAGVETGYRAVEYLKSTGTQYIQTDIVPSYSYKSELQIKFGSEIHQIENNDYTYIFGISGAANLGVYCAQLYGNSGNIMRFRDGYYSTDTSITGINPVVEDTLIMNRPTSFYGNASLTTNAAIESLDPPVEPIIIFGLIGVSAGNKRIWPFKKRDMFLYGFKIYDSNSLLLHDLVPVERVSDNELGLYDTVNGKFYTNAGTGTFEKGNYVEISDGTIPHGYKLPLTITSGAQSQDISIYIGDSKLGAEEYVDFGEQKVYKKKPNLVSDVLSGVGVSPDGILTLNALLNGAVTPIEQGKTYTIQYARNSGNMICGFYENYPEVNTTTYNGSRFIWNESYRTFIAPIDGYLISSCTPNTIDPIVYEGEYPQLTPADPPVPFPAISSYQGENTLSSTETLGEVEITGRIKSII